MSKPDHQQPASSGSVIPGSSLGKTHDADFAAFYRANTNELVAFLLLQGADAHLAADLVQKGMYVLYHRWPEVQHPRAWSHRTVSRALVRHLSTVRETPTPEPPESSPLLRGGVTDIERWEQQQDIVLELARLPPRQRQIMAWTLSGYTPTEIAQQLDMTPGAVRASLYQARKRLIANRREEDRQ